LTDNFFIVGQKPDFPNNLKLKDELVCNQMVIYNKINLDGKEDIIRLTNDDNDKLFHIVNLVQPGYFKANTSLLGDYFGIFKNTELVAVTGERMKMNSYTEVSAVVTHPLHTGNGYAKQLLAHTVNNIFDQNKIPYLHVSETNTAAIKLYEKLGFVTRRKISSWNLVSPFEKTFT
jgi:GNAT superfamily N-acetyltransferase